MGNGKRLHQNIVQFKTIAGLEQAPFQFCHEIGGGLFDAIEQRIAFAVPSFLDCPGGGFLCFPITINRNLQFPGQPEEAGDMVAVFVRDKNGRKIFRRPPNGREPLADLAGGKSRVNQDAGVFGFKVGAIAGGTAAQNGEFDGHERILTDRVATTIFFTRIDRFKLHSSFQLDYHPLVNGLLQRIEASIQDRRLLKRGEKVLVAVSGGSDSLALLHALKQLSPRHGWKIVAAHFNHRLRGRAGNLDERLVRQTALKLKLPMVAESGDVKSFAARSGLSIEMAARKLRHEFLARAAQARRIKTIALAHHADDQVELFFLRLLRGSGAGGLGGMKWKSPSPADRSLWLIRPLLDSTKARLLEFAAENKIRFRNDATNSRRDFLRNRIRNELLPLLRAKYQPALDKTVLRLMKIVGAESELVGQMAQRGGANFEELPPAIQRRILQRQLLEMGIAADFELIESLRRAPDRSVSIGAKMSAASASRGLSRVSRPTPIRRSRSRLFSDRPPATFHSVARDKSGKIELREGPGRQFGADELRLEIVRRAGEADFGGKKFKWLVRAAGNGAKPSAAFRAGLTREYFDADRIGGEILLRHWRKGDRFQPIGMKRPAKLQDLFVNAKIPRDRRHELVLAAAGSGEIFWVEGLRISENFKMMPRTHHVLEWQCLQNA